MSIKQLVGAYEKANGQKNIEVRRFVNFVLKGGSQSKRSAILNGGMFLAKGSYKCVLDHQEPIPCINKKLNPVREDEVQVILPKSEFEIEQIIYNMLGSPQEGFLSPPIPLSRSFLNASTLLINDQTFKCKIGKKYPSQMDKNMNIVKECKMPIDKKPQTLYVCILPKAERLTDPIMYLDIAYTLSRFRSNNMSHADVKNPNMVSLRNRGALIDVGLSIPFSAFERFPNIPKKPFKESLKLISGVSYLYWPKCMKVMFDNIFLKNIRISREEKWDVFQSIDKHGFIVDCIFYDMILDPNTFWKSVKTNETYSFDDEESDDANKNQQNVKPYHDPLPFNKFKSWDVIYEQLYLRLGSPMNRPPSMISSFWDKTTNVDANSTHTHSQSTTKKRSITSTQTRSPSRITQSTKPPQKRNKNTSNTFQDDDKITIDFNPTNDDIDSGDSSDLIDKLI